MPFSPLPPPISAAGVHNASYMHNLFFKEAISSQEVIYSTFVEQIGVPMKVYPGCNEIQERINSIQERMRFQQSIGFVFKKCIRLITNAAKAIDVTGKIITLRDCFIFHQQDLALAAYAMHSYCFFVDQPPQQRLL